MSGTATTPSRSPVPLRFFTPEAVDAAFGDTRQLSLRSDLAPLIERELGWAHYTELFRAAPERTTMPWAEFAERYAAGPDAELVAAAADKDEAPRTRDRLMEHFTSQKAVPSHDETVATNRGAHS
jgi:hypothetical protein